MMYFSANYFRVCFVNFIAAFAGLVTASAVNAEWDETVKPLVSTIRYMSEGATRQPYLMPNDFRGRRSPKYLKAVALYVSFPGTRATLSVEQTVAKLIGGTDGSNELDQFFEQQSDGRFRVDIDHQAVRGQMPHAVEHYSGSYYDYTTHRAFIQDAINQFDAVDFDDYDMVIVIPTHSNDTLPGASNLSDRAGSELVQHSNGSKIRRYITMGDNTYYEKKPARTVAHEIGHLFGFPDLYPYQYERRDGRLTDADYSLAGSWGIMSDSVRARDYLEWHRFKAGWLTSNNTAYMKNGVEEFTLSSTGIRMVVIPIDDVDTATSAYVIQRAPIIDSADYSKIHGGAGVIIYKVFGDRPTGQHPIEIKLPGTASGRHGKAFGNRYQSVFHKDHTFDNDHGIKVEVTNETPRMDGTNQTATIKITVDRALIRTELRKRSVLPKVTIGAQTWTAKNLDIATGNSVCYQNIDNNCIPHGRLYSYEAAQDACNGLGDGWDLPTDEDWLTLSDPLGGAYGTTSRDEGNSAYRALAPGGSTVFDAQFGGKLYFFDDTRRAYFYDQSEIGYFWASTLRNIGDVISYTMRKSDTKFLRENITRRSKVSVRCIHRAKTAARPRGDGSLQ